MEMVHVQFHMIQFLVHKSKVEQLVLRNIESILGMMVHRQHSFEWMAHSSSTQRMEMVLIQWCIVELMVHSSRGQLLVVHRNQSRHMELVHMIGILLFVHCMYSNQHMVMGYILGSIVELKVHNSKDQ